MENNQNNPLISEATNYRLAPYYDHAGVTIIFLLAKSVTACGKTFLISTRNERRKVRTLCVRSPPSFSGSGGLKGVSC